MTKILPNFLASILFLLNSPASTPAHASQRPHCIANVIIVTIDPDHPRRSHAKFFEKYCKVTARRSRGHYVFH